MSKYVMGVDAGSTKSHLAIFDTEENLAAFASWGPLNHEVLPGSFSQFEEELYAFIHKTASSSGIDISDIAYSVFGLGGVDTKEQHAVISDIIRRIGISSFTLCNDAYLGIAAVCPDNIGICCINGSGCTIAGMNAHRVLQIGGIGELSRDLGGAGQIGVSVLGAVYEALFRDGEPTGLTKPVLDALGIADKHDYADVISKKLYENSSLVSDLNRLLFIHSNDGVARKLLSDIAQNYAGGICCVVRELGFAKDKAIQIVFAGSVFAKESNPILTDMIKARLASSLPDREFSYTILEVPPVAGAIVWAMREHGICEDASTVVCARLREIAK